MYIELKDNWKSYITDIRVLKAGFLITTTGLESETFFSFGDICSIFERSGNLYLQFKPYGKKFLLLNRRYTEPLFISESKRVLYDHWLDYLVS